ncbi:hypothetical protein Tco_1071865, partial [Tanacetum coccineum]
WKLVKFLGLEGAVLRGEVCVLSNMNSVGGGGGGGGGSGSRRCVTMEFSCWRTMMVESVGFRNLLAAQLVARLMK